MKEKVIIIIFLLISSASFSQKEEKLLQLLDEVSTKIDKSNSLKIEFIIWFENLQDGSRNSHDGNAVYKKGLYKLDMLNQIVFSDGKTNWTYLKEADEINISSNNDSDMLTDPKSLLKDYKNKYKIRYIQEKFEKNRALVEVDFFPQDVTDKKYSKITLKLDKTKKQIYSVRYVGKDGACYLIEISKYQENINIPDAEIKYSSTLFPDAEIIDMR